MTDQLTPVPANLEVAGAKDFTIPSYDIAPADQAIANSILARDPLSDLAGSTKASAAEVPYSALSPDLRSEVDKALQGFPASRRGEAEQEAIVRVLSARIVQNRVLTGLGEGATEYDREMVDIAREYRQHSQEWNRVTARMTEVARHDTGPDGKPIPVYVMGPAGQRAAAAQLAEIDYRLSLLVQSDGSHGPEASRRLAKALQGSVEAEKAFAAQVAEMREAEVMAEKMLRDERIEARAKGIAKHRRVAL